MQIHHSSSTQQEKFSKKVNVDPAIQQKITQELSKKLKQVSISSTSQQQNSIISSSAAKQNNTEQKNTEYPNSISPSTNNNNNPLHKIYQVSTSFGRITVESTLLKQYIILIVTYSGLLKLSDGYWQVCHPTPYDKNPIVVHLQKQQGELSDSEKILQRLSQNVVKCPILMSINVDYEEIKKIKQGEQELYQVLKMILLKMIQQRQQSKGKFYNQSSVNQTQNDKMQENN